MEKEDERREEHAWGGNPMIQKAYDILVDLSNDQATRLLVKATEEYPYDEYSRVKDATDEGTQIGIKLGKEKLIHIMLNNGLSYIGIAKITNIPINEIEIIKENEVSLEEDEVGESKQEERLAYLYEGDPQQWEERLQVKNAIDKGVQSGIRQLVVSMLNNDLSSKELSKITNFTINEIEDMKRIENEQVEINETTIFSYLKKGDYILIRESSHRGPRLIKTRVTNLTPTGRINVEYKNKVFRLNGHEYGKKQDPYDHTTYRLIILNEENEDIYINEEKKHRCMDYISQINEKKYSVNTIMEKNLDDLESHLLWVYRHLHGIEKDDAQ